MSVGLPEWSAPKRTDFDDRNILINNSLAGGKVPFIPQEGNHVKWYMCGPTVYDASHMGHARTYVVFDAIYRIMTDYFKFDVNLVMNITDIDDKIIKKAQEEGKEFTEIARYWEQNFMEDLETLNVRPVTKITRVSDYLPQIIDFIKKIIENGFAYESMGSVYFDTEVFRTDPKHFYGRMEPSSINITERVLEGEGELGVITEKKSPIDFALWKKAKENEPSWDSEWGRGRPGWHIECSVMASEELGFPMDIHSGGCDLRFPHHDNELAQAEAYYDKPHWVNYFMHSGHLNIYGEKMAKTLKNFITIREAVQQYSPRVIRLLILMNRWDAPMNYAPDGSTMSEAIDVDRSFANFFASVKARLRKSTVLASEQEPLGDSNLSLSHSAAAEKVRAAFCDNFDTPAAIAAIQILISQCQKTMASGESDAKSLSDAAEFAFNILSILGIAAGEGLEYLGRGDESVGDVMDVLVAFRKQVRENAQDLLKIPEAASRASSLLAACDNLRDESLVPLGIELRDSGSETSWIFKPPEELKRERELKSKEADRRRLEKEARRLAEEEKQRARDELAAIPPNLLFIKTRTSEFSVYDNNGIPTHLANGEEVSKSQKDKFRKTMKAHEKLHARLQSDATT